MDTFLGRELRSFEEIVEFHLPQGGTGRRVATALRELYGTRSAVRLMSYFLELCGQDCRNVLETSRVNDPITLGSRLPHREVFQNQPPKLIEAIERKNWNQALEALHEMSVPELCSNPVQMFERLEFQVGLVIGRARLIPLVELAFLASEMADFNRVGHYLADAHTLAPEPPELHDLYTLEGMISLAANQVEDAKQSLAKSVEVCRLDENARVLCGIRPMNLILAELLLERGERVSVIAYLDRCRQVWSYEDKPLTACIRSIKMDQKPDFLDLRMRNVLIRPKAKIRDLALRGVFLEEEPDEKTRVDVNEIRAQFKKEVDAALKGKLNLGGN